MGAILYDLGRQPRAARAFFERYRDYHAFWKLYGMGLTDDVLRAVYNGNARRIIPRMPTQGFGEG